MIPHIDMELAILINGPKYADVKDVVMRQFQRIYCDYLLCETGGRIALAAKMAGTDRSRFKQMMRAAGLRTTAGRNGGEA